MKDDTRNFLPRSERHASLDLLDQVADSTAECDNVRKILSEPIDYAAHTCSRCESGLSRCVTPQACERAEQSKGRAERAAVGIVLLVTAALMLGAVVATALIAAGVMP